MIFVGRPTTHNTWRHDIPDQTSSKQQRSSKRIRRSFVASSLPLEEKASTFQDGAEAHHHHGPRAGTAGQPPDEAGTYVVDSDVLALASLDEDSHQRARLRDANTYMNEVLFPLTFPWYNSREPLVKTIPRDIDELYAVVYADNDDASIRQDGREGPVPDLFGYGKCETGQERQQGAIPTFAMGGYDAVVSAARRGDDPGQIELTATMPPPPSLEAAIVYHEQRNNANAPKGAAARSTNLEEADQDTIERLKATIEAERAGACSRMPMYCEPIDGGNYFNPPAFLSSDDEPESMNGTLVGDQEDSGIYLRDRQLGQRRKLAKACARKWKISIKAGGSSTRTRIFRAEVTCGNEGGVLSRPMLRTAMLPSSVLSGQKVPVGVAAEFDRRESLGSYDVRANASATEKAASSTEAKKKIAIGRTRLVWTKKNEKAEGASKYGKSTYTSIITGQKLETNAQKRPREVRVGVRLNGHLLMEQVGAPESSNEAKSPASILKGGKKAKQTDVVVDGGSISPLVPANDNRKVGEIKRAIDAAFDANVTQKGRVSSPGAASSSSIVIVEPTVITANVAARIKRAQNVGAGKGVGSSTPTASTKEDVKKQPASKDAPQNESMDFVTMKHGATLALKHVAPQYGLLPLDDGLLRAICIVPGSMNGTSVNNMLNAASRERKANRLCSVCWTGDAVGGLGGDLCVQECVDCGISVHLDCCENRGDFVRVPAVESSGGASSVRSGTMGQEILRWRCAVCVDSSNLPSVASDGPPEEMSIAAKKPRRTAKLPSRFTEGETHLAGHSSSRSLRNRPSPGCSLCPHSGGAMSMLENSATCAQGKAPAQPLWTHEVCRVWCQATTTPSVMTASPSSATIDRLRSNSVAVCVLCGTGTCSVAGGGIDSLPPGLVKCAAKGCCATFHPMCALLATRMLPRPATTPKSAEDSTCTPNSPKSAKPSRKTKPSETAGAAGKKNAEKIHDLEERRTRDIHLCKQYTLTLAEVNHDGGAGSTVATIVPVAFCGLHNPQREAELIGCLPGGGVTC